MSPKYKIATQMFWGNWLLVICNYIYMEFLAFCLVEALGDRIDNDTYRDSTHNTILSEGNAWIVSCTSDSILVF
jgi:hypothetical protein